METALRVPKHGRGKLLRGGKIGNPGGGRHPNWLKNWCDELLASRKSKAATEKILSDPDHPAYAAMWRAVADRAHGKPMQQVEHTGADGGPVKFTFALAVPRDSSG